MTKLSGTIVFVSASALSCFALLIVPVLRAKKAKCNPNQIHYCPTPRNKKILKDAVSLRITEPWGYSNRHFATFLAQVRLPPFGLQWNRSLTRKFETLTSPSGCSIEVEFISKASENPSSTVPMVILLHGIGGHSREVYIQQATSQFIEKGWKVAVLNYSKISCTSQDSSTPMMAVGGTCLTDVCDLNFLISHIRKSQSAFLAAVGFSMGGSKLVQYLLRAAEHSHVDCAAIISSPLDFSVENDTVHEPRKTLVSTVYHLLVSSYIKVGILRQRIELEKHHDLQPFRRSKSGLLFWLKANSVPDIDREITMRLKGRQDLRQYYNNASTLGKLHEMKIPFLCITALNDPFIPQRIVPSPEIAKRNENIFIANTERGGHIGFWLPWHGCWATCAVISFLDSCRVHLPSSSNQSPYLTAQILQSTSYTGLTNYFDFIDLDS